MRYLKIEDRSVSASGAPLAGFDLDSVTVLSGTDGPSLTADVDQISLSSGGTQRLSLVAPTPGALYYMLLTETGSSPGTIFPSSFLSMPLNGGAVFDLTASKPNLIVKKGLAFLNSSGQKTARLIIPPGSDSTLSGLSFHHAYMLLDLVTFKPTFVSNPTPLTLIP